MSSRLRAFLAGCALLVSCLSSPAAAQEHRAAVFGTAGFAGIGHADSEQGKAPIYGGGIALHLTPRLIVDADVHGARISHVFGREHHDFSQVTFTGSVLFRSSPEARVHFLGGGGVAVQRAHSEFTQTPVGLVENTETIRLLHGRAGAEWDLTSRWVLRTEGVFWMGGGLDWVTGARVGVGYRF